MKGWPPERFRTTLQGFFLPTGLLILAGHGIAGLWTGEVVKIYLYSLPAIGLGVVLGGLVNRKLTHDLFAKLVYGFLVLMGGILLVRTLL